jgi:Xaa-Pro aminopeptidase
MSNNYPDYTSRLAKLKLVIAKNGIKGVFLHQSRDVFYFTGTAQPSWLAVTQDDARLFVKSGIEFATDDLRLGGISFESERNLGKALDKAFGPPGNYRIGLELDVMTVPQFRQFEATLDGCKIVDVSEDILTIRQIKDAYEIAAVERACKAVDAGHLAAIKSWQPGMSELEASAIAEHGHRCAGHEGDYFLRQADFSMGRGPFASGENIGKISGVVFSVTGTGLSPAVPAGASRQTMSKGDLIVIDIPTCVDGYHADQSRTYSLGPASNEAKALHQALRGIADRLLADMIPGHKTSEIYNNSLRYAAELGVKEEFLSFPNGQRSHFVGHGVGLDINEPPFLTARAAGTLQAGMVLAIELHACLEGKSIVKLEDTVVVEENGGRVLNLTPRELTEIEI